MASIDDQIESIQNSIIRFLIERENYITEYVTIPLFYEYVFHSTRHHIFRSFLISALIAHNLVKMVNAEKLKLTTATALTPLTAYVALTDPITASVFYALFYSNNLYESAYLSLSTGVLYYYYQSFLGAYFFHALYIFCKSSIFLNETKMRNHHNTRIDILFQHKTPPVLKERLLEIGNESGTFINNIFEPLRFSFNVKM